MVAATVADELLSAVDTARLAEGAQVAWGAGFWLFGAALVLAPTAMALLLLGFRSVGPGGGIALPGQPRREEPSSAPEAETADSGRLSP
jgi:hypothetical protein